MSQPCWESFAVYKNFSGLTDIMKRFVLKKLFDIRPLTKKGELDLAWIFKQGRTIKIDRHKITRLTPTQSVRKPLSIIETKKRSNEINFPAWENIDYQLGKKDYEYESIRQEIMEELEKTELREKLMKHNFGPPVNLPLEKESARKKKLSHALKRLSPQKLDLRLKLPSFRLNPKLKYALLVGLFLLIILPTLYILPRISSTKEMVLTSGKEAYQNLLAGQEALFLLDAEAAAENFKQAYAHFSSAQKAVNKLGGSLLSAADILPISSKLSSGKKLLKAGELIAQSGEYLSLSISTLNLLDFSDVFEVPDQGIDEVKTPNFYLKNFQHYFSLASRELSSGLDLLKEVETTDLPAEYRDQFASLNRLLPQIEQVLKNFDPYFNLFLAILGEEGPRHYLVLFQNNAEIRATGGFIGSYALLKTHKGFINNLEVKNIFDADGQLVVNIIPPKPIQKISSGWSTHDANWFFDFPTSAEKISWFFEKTGGPTVDGIIALMPSVVENLLKITGPVNLENEYKLVIDADNFVEEIQYKVEKDYDPYLNQPKKILADFTEKFFIKLANLPREKWPELFQVFTQALRTKNLLLWMRNSQEQEFIRKQGWSNEVIQTEGDYLALVHSNINGYKTDLFIEEEIKLDIAINASAQAIHTLTLRRRHTGGNEKYEWYNQVNADYLRVYLPQNVLILEASGHTPEIILPPLDYEAARFRQDELVASIEASLVKDPKWEIDIFEESGKKVIGAWLYTSPGEETVFILKYILPLGATRLNSGLPNDEALNYFLTIQKQPGAYDAPLRLSLSYPDYWRIQEFYPREKLISQKPIRVRDVLDIDKFFSIGFKTPNQ